MAFRERVLWASLAATLGVWGWYFWKVVRAMSIGLLIPGHLFVHFITAVVMIAIIMSVVAILLAVMAPKAAGTPADDREREIERAAYRPGYVVLSLCVWATVIVVPWWLNAPRPLGLSPAVAAGILFSNALLFAIVAGEVARTLAQIIRFRRGA